MIMYGRGVTSIAEQIKGSIKDAQKIVDDFYTNFPKIKNWVTATEEFAKRTGYVEDLWGRRRRLPDIQLPRYTAKEINASKNSDFNPLLGSKGLFSKQKNPKIDYYLKESEKCKYKKDRDELKARAYKDGIILDDNNGFIAQAARQCVNARVQGGAATMSKKAMIKVYRDQELKDLGFRLMLAVHDELIGECPEENKDKVADRLTYLMKISALPECVVPFKCDPTIEKVWYYTDYSDYINKEHRENLDNGLSEEESFSKICDIHCECTERQLKEMLI